MCTGISTVLGFIVDASSGLFIYSRALELGSSDSLGGSRVLPVASAALLLVGTKVIKVKCETKIKTHLIYEKPARR